MKRLDRKKDNNTADTLASSRRAQRRTPKAKANYDSFDNDCLDDDSEGGDSEEVDGEEVGVKQKSQQSLSSSPDEIMVNMLLERVPLDRSLLKKKSHLLLQYSLGKSQDEDGLTEYELIDAAEDAAAGDAAAVDAAAAAANSDDASDSGNNNHGDGGGADVDPMAVSMVKSTIAKYLSQITRGEYSIQSAARVVASHRSSNTVTIHIWICVIWPCWYCTIATWNWWTLPNSCTQRPDSSTVRRRRHRR